MGGRLFTLFSSIVDPKEVLLYLDCDGADKPGMLYWIKPGEARGAEAVNKNNRFSLGNLVEIRNGCEQSGFLTSAAQSEALDTSKCFAFVASDGTTLNLQAKTAKQRDSWAYGIRSLLREENLTCKIRSAK